MICREKGHSKVVEPTLGRSLWTLLMGGQTVRDFQEEPVQLPAPPALSAATAPAARRPEGPPQCRDERGALGTALGFGSGWLFKRQPY